MPETIESMRKKLGRRINLVGAEEPPEQTGACVFDRTFAASNELKNEVLDALLAELLARGALAKPGEDMQARLCLDEALVNAVMHGCQYDASKAIRVRAYCGAAKWSVLVEDPGGGFREEDLPDPNAAENLLEESGRGILLMRAMMDEVSYWRGGSALLLSKKR
ncbi:MAG: ATP-binding protein [Planctomycetota bacterium]